MYLNFPIVFYFTDKIRYYYLIIILENKSENIEPEAIDKKKTRKSKKDSTERNFLCDICNKSYLSYPALYTHKRNKHNIIPITGKPDFFRNANLDSQNKFKYNTQISKKDLTENLMKIINCYKSLIEEYYLNTRSTLYKKNYNNDDIFLNELNEFLKIDLLNITVPKSEQNLNIDTILIIYAILLIKVKSDFNFICTVTKFIFLFREYLNMIGWDYIKNLQDYGLCERTDFSKLFTIYNNCEEIPELLEDFGEVFLEIDSVFSIEKFKISDIAENFCYWLYINDLTPYKLLKLD